MPEYIEREAVMKLFDKVGCYLNPKCLERQKKQIEDLPTADVAEVRHGEWLPDYETFVDEWERESEPIQTGWVCSLCGRQEWKKEPYCNCGAKMDGKDGAGE